MRPDIDAIKSEYLKWLCKTKNGEYGKVPLSHFKRFTSLIVYIRKLEQENEAWLKIHDTKDEMFRKGSAAKDKYIERLEKVTEAAKLVHGSLYTTELEIALRELEENDD